MQYIRTAGWEDGVADLTERLVRELAGGKRVLWLTSGGSNIKTSAQIMDNISPGLSRKLSILLADERYGPVGHPDSNFSQLLAANFKPKKAKMIPILEDNDLGKTTARYGKLVKKAYLENDLVIALLGIGQDGHIAGILPDSPATDEGNDLVIGYEAPPYTRMTLTFTALKQVSVAYVFAFGDTKRNALKNLQNQTSPLAKQPSQILKHIPEAYVYSDQFGDQP